MKIIENDEMADFFYTMFDFIKKYRIHSFADHLSNYTPILQIILDSDLTDFRYNERFDSYSFHLENVKNTLVDIVLIFTFGESVSNRIMITLNNKNIYFELALDNEKHIPLFKYNETKSTGFLKIFKKKKEEVKKEIMNNEEFNIFLSRNGFQKPLRTMK